MLAPIPAAVLQIPLPANANGKASEGIPVWGFYTCMEDLDGVPGFCFQPGPALSQ